MIKKLAIVLLSSLLLVGSMGQTVEASHGFLWTYCSGDFQLICEPNISSWSYRHTHDDELCYVYGWVERRSQYCYTCGEKKDIQCWQNVRHDYDGKVYYELPVRVG